MSTPTSSPNRTLRRPNTTPKQITGIISFFEENKKYFDVIIRKIQPNVLSSEKQINKQEVYEAMFTYLNEKNLIPGWTPDLMKSRLHRLLTKFNETYEASLESEFRLTNKDTKKGISTIEEKLERLCPGYERFMALFGKTPIIRPYRISFHGEPTEHTNVNPVDDPSQNLSDLPESSTAINSRDKPSTAATFINSTPVSINRSTMDSSSIDHHTTDHPINEHPTAERSTVEHPPAEHSTEDRSGVSSDPVVRPPRRERDEDDDANATFISDYFRSKRRKYKREGQLDMLRMTLDAIRYKIFGDIHWRKVARNMLVLEKLLERPVTEAELNETDVEDNDTPVQDGNPVASNEELPNGSEEPSVENEDTSVENEDNSVENESNDKAEITP